MKLPKMNSDNWDRKWVPKIENIFMNLSIFGKKANVRNKVKNGVLVDVNIHGWSVTHESASIVTGDIQWGPLFVKNGATALARIPKYAPDDQSREFGDVKFLVPISALAKKGFLKLWSSVELKEELFRQPSGRYRGYSIDSYCLIPDTDAKPIDGHNVENRVWGPAIKYDSAEAQRDRLNKKTDHLYRELAKWMPDKHSQDVWHVYTAEKYQLFCFLTMDYKFINAVRSAQNKTVWANLKTKIMTPTEFGLMFNLVPLDPAIFTDTDLTCAYSRPDLVYKPKKKAK